MALNGTINGSTSNKYIDAKIVWSATQSIVGNYSDVTATLSYSRNNTGYTTGGTWSGSITINGTKTSGSKYMTITYKSSKIPKLHNGVEVGFPPLFFISKSFFVQVQQIKNITSPKFHHCRMVKFRAWFAFLTVTYR